MTIQIVSLSFPDVFKSFSNKYKIFRDVYQKGLFGLELREMPNNLADTVQKIVLWEKQICYKIKGDNNSLNLFIPGTILDFKELSRRILSSGDEDLGYKIINVIKNYEEYDSKVFEIAGKDFPFNKAYVMGILNVTPDSFSDGGLYTNVNDAVDHALMMIEEGADIIDIGGESTRPGSNPVSADEELKRVLPVLQNILSSKPDTVISVDTTKSIVAEEALDSGAKIINDISAGLFDPEIINTVKKHKAAYILMHIKGNPATMQQNPYYENVISELYDFLSARSAYISKAGIKNIFIDPGIGFGKRSEDNFEILRRLEDFKGIGFPLLIGVSRKSFIGKTLNLEVDQRDIASAILEGAAIKNGARIIRTHNVKNAVQAVRLLDRTI